MATGQLPNVSLGIFVGLLKIYSNKPMQQCKNIRYEKANSLFYAQYFIDII